MDESESVADFYAAAAPRLVALLTLTGSSRDDAEELVQDAFAKLLPRWTRVSAFDDPEAWVRRVALNMRVSRARRASVARRGLRLLSSRPTLPPPEPLADRLDLRQALRRLPEEQRTVLVLHYVTDLTAERISADLGVPLGTVKSRLSRGRLALAQLMEEEVVPDA